MKAAGVTLLFTRWRSSAISSKDPKSSTVKLWDFREALGLVSQEKPLCLTGPIFTACLLCAYLESDFFFSPTGQGIFWLSYKKHWFGPDVCKKTWKRVSAACISKWQIKCTKRGLHYKQPKARLRNASESIEKNKTTTKYEKQRRGKQKGRFFIRATGGGR